MKNASIHARPESSQEWVRSGIQSALLLKDIILIPFICDASISPRIYRVFVSDEGLRGGRTLPLKKIVDDACKGLESLVEHVFVFKRTVTRYRSSVFLVSVALTLVWRMDSFSCILLRIVLTFSPPFSPTLALAGQRPLGSRAVDGRARRVDGRIGVGAAARVPPCLARLGRLALHFVHFGLHRQAQRSGPLHRWVPALRGHDLPGAWKKKAMVLSLDYCFSLSAFTSQALCSSAAMLVMSNACAIVWISPSFASLTATQESFGLRPDDVHACVADCGWITGHSYIVYGPLLNGCTTVMFESTPLYPNPGRYWDLVSRHKVTSFYTAPTAIRALMAHGNDHVIPHDLSSLRVLGTVGEPINPEAWKWLVI